MRSGWFRALILALLSSGCGDKEAAIGAPADGAAPPCQQPQPSDAGVCSPALSSCWAPVWKPPHAPVSACTESQIVEDMAKCWGDVFDPDCTVFERDPANAACLRCLFSTQEEPTYGPLILLANGSIQTNVPGCLAIVDGDSSPTSCAAKYQSYYECFEDACEPNCPTYDDYDACTAAATSGLCASFLQDAVCRRKPQYAICNSYTTFEEFFLGVAKIFCAPGPDAGASADGGVTPGDAGGDP